jgi:RsiW-degrading membrane proteinase PrsW (M82 family)
MAYIPLFILLLMTVVNVIFRFASLFRLTVPMLYAIAMPVFFPDWLHAHETLATVIGCALIGLVIASWVVTIRKRLRRRTTQPDNG